MDAKFENDEQAAGGINEDLISQMQAAREQCAMLTHYNNRLNERVEALVDENNSVSTELKDLQSEIRNTSVELNVLRVDFQTEHEMNEELVTQVREIRRKYRNAQLDLQEADRATTKRLSRLIERLEAIEKDNRDCKARVEMWETDAETAGVLCFVCRNGIKTVKCSKCNEGVCRNCYESVEKCSFCRGDLATRSDDVSEAMDGYGD